MRPRSLNSCLTLPTGKLAKAECPRHCIGCNATASPTMGCIPPSQVLQPLDPVCPMGCFGRPIPITGAIVPSASGSTCETCVEAVTTANVHTYCTNTSQSTRLQATAMGTWLLAGYVWCRHCFPVPCTTVVPFCGSLSSCDSACAQPSYMSLGVANENPPHRVVCVNCLAHCSPISPQARYFAYRRQ